MFSLRLDTRQADRDLLLAELWEAGCCGILETGSGLRAFFEDDRRAPALRDRFSGHLAGFEFEEPRDWVQVSRSSWQPLLVGSRFFLAPDWLDSPAPPGRLRISINPGLACGSGAHEATQLCLEAAERFLRPGMTVLDIGAGSGILTEAAWLLGAGRVLACDIDPEALAVARSRLETAAVRAPLFHGSAAAARSASVDLVLANISAAAVAELSPDIVRCLRTGGIALLSGFEAAEQQAVEAAFQAAGGAVLGAWRKAGWTLLAGCKENWKKTGTFRQPEV